MFRKLGALESARGKRDATRLVIEDWIRWGQYKAHTSEAQRNSEREFTSVSDRVDNVIEGKCHDTYMEFVRCAHKDTSHCKDKQLKLDKCVNVYLN